MLRLQADSQAAAERFLARVVGTGEVWLLDDDGFIAGCDSNRCDRFVVPFFSARAYAARGNRCRDGRFVPVSISLERFMTKVLPVQIAENNLVGLDWDGAMTGVEAEPRHVLDEVRRRLG